MTWVIDAFLVAVVCIPLPATILFAAEILASLRSVAPREIVKAPCPCTVIVPAHNEASSLLATLENIAAQLRTNDRLLVVADNCTDATAQCARTLGVDVIERNDMSRRGKGYALAFGLEHAAQWGNAVTIIVDADCLLGSNTVAILAEEAWRTGRPVQADYLIEAPIGSSRKLRFSAFAFRLKNRARLLGAMRLGIPSVLTGSGMAFPTKLIERSQIGSGEIVEDLLLSVELAMAGYPARYCAYATVTSSFPADPKAADSQRKRWEGGYLSVMQRFAARLLMRGLARANIQLVFFGLDVAIPPLSLLALIGFGCLALGMISTTFGLGIIPFTIASCELAILASVLVVAWFRFGRDLLSTAELALIPVSVIMKILFYVKLISSPSAGWVRTARIGDSEAVR